MFSRPQRKRTRFKASERMGIAARGYDKRLLVFRIVFSFAVQVGFYVVDQSIAFAVVVRVNRNTRALVAKQDIF